MTTRQLARLERITAGTAVIVAAWTVIGWAVFIAIGGIS